MQTMKPIKISSIKANPNEKLSSAEMGKLWATYMGNNMSKCIISYCLQHVEDEDIRTLLKNALHLNTEFMKTIKDIFTKEHFPIPIGFTEDDVNLGAPRLFEDEFYVHYLKYAAKAGLSLYTVAIPLMYREDVRNFFIHCMNSTVALVEQIKDVLINKGLIIKPPPIPVPEKVEFAKQNYLKGFTKHARPLHALEITHLYDNIENNVTSKALLMGFSQVAKTEKVQELFIRGTDITHKIIERYIEQLQHVHLPSPSFLDHLVTTSTFSPFSDKLMLFHKMDMFSMKIRTVGGSMAVNGRHDIALMYTKSLMHISLFVEDTANLMMENDWMEKPPEAVNRDSLASK